MAGAFLDVVEALRYTKTFIELEYSACDMRGAYSFNTVCNCSSVTSGLNTYEQNTWVGEKGHFEGK